MHVIEPSQSQQALWASINHVYRNFLISVVYNDPRSDLAHKHTTVSTILLFGCALWQQIIIDIHYDYESVYQVDFPSPMCEFPYISYVLSVVHQLIREFSVYTSPK